MAPASMSKLMTVLMMFERLGDGSLAMDDTFPVSEKAWVDVGQWAEYRKALKVMEDF